MGPWDYWIEHFSYFSKSSVQKCWLCESTYPTESSQRFRPNCLPSLVCPLLDQACLLVSVSPSINASTLHYLVLGSRELPLLGPSISCGPWEEVGWEAVGSDRQSRLRPSIPLSLGITLPFFWCKGYWENWITSSLFLGIGASQKWILGSFMGA